MFIMVFKTTVSIKVCMLLRKMTLKFQNSLKTFVLISYKQLDYQLQRKIKTPFKCIGVTLILISLKYELFGF